MLRLWGTKKVIEVDGYQIIMKEKKESQKTLIIKAEGFTFVKITFTKHDFDVIGQIERQFQTNVNLWNKQENQSLTKYILSKLSQPIQDFVLTR